MFALPVFVAFIVFTALIAGVRLGHALERDVIGFAGAEQRNGRHMADEARHREFRRAGGLGGGEQLLARERRRGGKQHQRLALGRIAARRGGVDKAGRGGSGVLLDDFERNHLARDLGKALDAPANGDKTFIVDRDDVARRVPARALGGRRLNHAGLVVEQIAFHHVRPLHVQRAAVVDAGHRLQRLFDAGQQLADRADLAGHRHIDGDHRRAFGDAVAFQNTDAELLNP